MKTIAYKKNNYRGVLHLNKNEKADNLDGKATAPAFKELERRVLAALETYSNVHRGTGHYSIITTELFERARDIILDFLGMGKEEYMVIFCTPQQCQTLKSLLEPEDYKIISSRKIGLPIGLRALVVKKNSLPEGVPFQTGGSVVKMVSRHSVVWADAPQKFEAGTPSVMNVITLAAALNIMKERGNDCFRQDDNSHFSESEILYKDNLSGYAGQELLSELRKQLVGYNLHVPTAGGEKPFANLDNGASTPTFFPVWNVVNELLHIPEKVYADIVEEVKNIIGGFLGADREKYDIIFTCNTTEAFNIVSGFVQYEFNDDNGLVILNTLLEHNSNELPWRFIPEASLIRLPVDKDGFVNPEDLELILKRYNLENKYGRKRIRIVAVSGASNVLGTFNDLQALSSIAHKYGARILVDAAQLIAHRSINIDELGIDYLAFSGHKVYAPFGSGALIIRKELVRASLFDLEKIRSSGEENTAGIAALGKVITLLQRIGMDVIEQREKQLVSQLLKNLSGIDGIEIYGVTGRDTEKLNHKGAVVSFRLKDIPHNLAAKELAEQGGIGVRNGCFCAHLLVKDLLNINPVEAVFMHFGFILLPGLTRAILPGLVRVSLGLENDENDIDRLTDVLEKITSSPQSIINRLLALRGNGTPFVHQTITGEQMLKFLETRIQQVYIYNKSQ